MQVEGNEISENLISSACCRIQVLQELNGSLKLSKKNSLKKEERFFRTKKELPRRNGWCFYISIIC